MILASIPLIVAAIAGLVLFTNVDEVISESIEIDTSSLNYVTNTWPIDSLCDVYLVKYVEFEKLNASKWTMDNFSEERNTLFDSVKVTAWDSKERTQAYVTFFDSIDKKTTPDLRGYVLQGYVLKEELQKDPQCYEILLEKYPERIVG